MLQLYVVRHGQTEWNTQKRMQGHNDSPLTELGIKQAFWQSKALRDVDFDSVFSSSSGRAVKTAEIILGDRNTPVIPREDLRELNLGEWEGQSLSDVEKRYPAQSKNFWESPHLYQTQGGESFEQMIQRVKGFMDSMAQAFGGKRVLAVTHTVTIKVMNLIVENKELKDLWSGAFIKPTSLSVFEYENGIWKTERCGDVSHYEETN